MKKVTIIGGGIIGLSCAYYLQKEGHEVIVVDQSSMNEGASYINAGYLCPSHIVPMAAPGVMKQGLKWMLNSKSPLYIKPNLNPDFLKWSWAFHKSCTEKHVKRSIKAIKEIAVMGRELYSDIKNIENFSFQLDNKGLLMICNSEKLLEEEIEVAHLAKKEGLPVEILDKKQLDAIEPKLQIAAKGAVHYQSDRHTSPHIFMSELKAHLQNKGVAFFQNEKVVDFKFVNGKIKEIITDKQQFKSDEIVLAAGAWSHYLAKKIGTKLLLQPGKGYSINTKETKITVPAILCEAKVAITPMKGLTRFAGTMEIAGINSHINRDRVRTIVKAAKTYYPEVNIDEKAQQGATSGLRPVSPDGLPYIGKSVKCKNLVFATGHAMMGWTMGPSTGKLVSEIISDKKTSLPIEAYHPDRRFG